MFNIRSQQSVSAAILATCYPATTKLTPGFLELLKGYHESISAQSFDKTECCKAHLHQDVFPADGKMKLRFTCVVPAVTFTAHHISANETQRLVNLNRKEVKFFTDYMTPFEFATSPEEHEFEREKGRSVLSYAHEHWLDGFVAFQVGYNNFTRGVDSKGSTDTEWSQKYDYFGMQFRRFSRQACLVSYLSNADFPVAATDYLNQMEKEREKTAHQMALKSALDKLSPGDRQILESALK